MVNWFCSSSLCFNNFRKTTPDGEKLKFYRLPAKDKELQNEYVRILKTEGMNFSKGHICCEHFSSGLRKDPTQLPDIPCPLSQIPLMEKKISLLKNKILKNQSPVDEEKYKKKLKTMERKLSVMRENCTIVHTRKEPKNRLFSAASQKKYNRELSKKELHAHVKRKDEEIKRLQQKLANTENHVKFLKCSLKEQKAKTMVLQRKNSYLEKLNKDLPQEILKLKSICCNFEALKERPKIFKYLCGLDTTQFTLLLDCVSPYFHHIVYPDCKGSQGKNRALDKPTELLSVLIICRHALHSGVMAFMLDIAESTMYRIFTGWVIFMDTFFAEIDLKVPSSYIRLMMPAIFKKTGHGTTDIVIDATEFKLQQPTNYDLNTLTFSNYKNTNTGKALIGITPHGSGLIFSDVYPGSISDSEITEKTDILQFVETNHEIMADRGFSIQDLCSSKGVYLNRPCQKREPQFQQADIAGNFDIASCRIHVERYIGCVRDWSILNAVWPIQRIDVLNSTWKMLYHIVNLTMKPIGPKKN